MDLVDVYTTLQPFPLLYPLRVLPRVVRLEEVLADASDLLHEIIDFPRSPSEQGNKFFAFLNVPLNF
jgi:hypothetical protein